MRKSLVKPVTRQKTCNNNNNNNELFGSSARDRHAFSSLHYRRSIRQGFCAPDFANFSDIIDNADDDLFKQILSNPNHVLAPLLPDKTESHYSLSHDRQLIPKLTKLYDSNFIVRMLYKQVYWHSLLVSFVVRFLVCYILHVFHCTMRFVIVIINKRIWMNEWMNAGRV